MKACGSVPVLCCTEYMYMYIDCYCTCVRCLLRGLGPFRGCAMQHVASSTVKWEYDQIGV